MENEKALERQLVKRVKKAGGWSFKLGTGLVAGLPDRLCLFPGGRFAFVEVKGTGLEPTKLQKIVHRRLNALGFTVWVIDSTAGIDLLMGIYGPY